MSTNELRNLVAAWMPTQRWFQGKDRDAAIEVTELASIGDSSPMLTTWIARVDYGDDVEHYQLPLVFRSEPVDSLDHMLLGTLDGDGPTWVYDALHDKDVTQAYLLGIRDGGDAWPISFHRTTDADDIPVGEASLVLKAEQSNTSLVYGDVAILKVFRRLQSGLNPDIEVHEALTAIGGRHVAKLLGYVSAEIDGESTSLGMLQEFLTSGTDGWELAKTSIRDLIAEADLHAEEAGGDFAGEAHRLGVAVAEVHVDLAAAFGTGELDASALRDRADRMGSRLDAALEVVPKLADYEEALRAAFEDFADASASIPTHRIHGDLHLGQVMRTVRRWVVLDFEGQPLTDIETRRSYDSPLRDVAGMLRSFDYAAWHQIVDISHTGQLEYRAMEWADRNRDAFCAGYAEGSGSDPRDAIALLRGFEADKAVYEAVYEARNRPNWLAIPLSSLNRLCKGAKQ